MRKSGCARTRACARTLSSHGEAPTPAIAQRVQASSVFMLTPPLVAPRDQERAGFLLSLLLNLGITLGAQASLSFI